MADTRELFSDTSDFDLLGQPDREWPVVIERVERFVVWVDGEDAAAAASLAADGSTWEWPGDTDLDGSITARTPDRFEWQEINDSCWATGISRRHGPVWACPECGDVEDGPGQKPRHRGDCSQHEHHWRHEQQRHTGVWVTFCYCTLRPGSNWARGKAGPGHNAEMRYYTPALGREVLVAHLRGRKQQPFRSSTSSSPSQQAVLDALQASRPPEVAF